MMFKVTLVYFSLVFIKLILAQETDLNELANSLITQEVPVRWPRTQIGFNKDSSPLNATTRIIGGDVATPHEYPFQVALYIFVFVTQYLCGGSLITPDWVLTAAHCVEDATSILVYLGVHDLSQVESSRVVYNSTEYIMHEQWDSVLIQNDVALIRLPSTTTLNSYINTIPIATGTNTFSGLISRTFGWGRTLTGGYSNELRYVDAEVITNEQCSSFPDYEPYIVDHHLCTSGAGIVGSCGGDSGGPVIYNGIQIGIVSFGHSDCAGGYPSANARLTEFSTWINNTIVKYNGGDGNKHKLGLLSSLYMGIILSIVIANCS